MGTTLARPADAETAKKVAQQLACHFFARHTLGMDDHERTPTPLTARRTPHPVALAFAEMAMSVLFEALDDDGFRLPFQRATFIAEVNKHRDDAQPMSLFMVTAGKLMRAAAKHVTETRPELEPMLRALRAIPSDAFALTLHEAVAYDDGQALFARGFDVAITDGKVRGATLHMGVALADGERRSPKLVSFVGESESSAREGF